MTGRSSGAVAALALALALSGDPATAIAAKTSAPKDTPSSSPVQILPGTGSKEPISIDADKLVYFDKEKKAIYSGDVVVVQGDTKMTASKMTVFIEQSDPAAADGKASDGKAPDKTAETSQGPSQNSGIRRMEAEGPVTVISKTQVATGDRGTYDKAEDRVQLIGHVTLSDGPNVTKGDKLTYDLKTGQAVVETSGGKSGRVHGQFTPGQGDGPGKSEPGKSEPGKTK